jgi:hypothetical protein
MTHFILTIIDDLGDCRTEPYKTRETADRAAYVLRGYGWIVGLAEVAGNAPAGAI